ncbi:MULTISPECIES: hypothetical protein [Aerococcus]|nr:MULTISPECIES: hypothetical protein [Aerococcus]MDK6369294.1 hypothetical protein [Aerococcus sp. UMB9870]MDK6679118.1 hypothetical protein [Aerococcus sp. UMB8608]MDK6687025.1 hypothetical protein [Aerococcus sp. UMB8623]OFK13995.1 hypothetical protein HMPREF2829_09545 [Aerococcus sp. HMSC072A12]OFR34850.1 hypothetical protein HMPREF2892_02265 [Aerococcus sp. HMSC061A03]
MKNKSFDPAEDSEACFKLISELYNAPDIIFPAQTREKLLEAARLIEEDQDIDQALALSYQALKKFSAKERLTIPELKALTDFVQSAFYKHQGKELWNFYTVYGAMTGPFIF